MSTPPATVLVPLMPDHSTYVQNRRKFIDATLAEGKAVRFIYPNGITKDINEFKEDGCDLIAFRMQGSEAPYICWKTFGLTTEAVDL